MAAKAARKDYTMKSVIQKDEAAVSPVIATILMVAITVVLAAVLYVMVSGLITPVGGNKPLGRFGPGRRGNGGPGTSCAAPPHRRAGRRTTKGTSASGPT